jgi:hypothetical protein
MVVPAGIGAAVVGEGHRRRGQAHSHRILAVAGTDRCA